MSASHGVLAPLYFVWADALGGTNNTHFFPQLHFLAIGKHSRCLTWIIAGSHSLHIHRPSPRWTSHSRTPATHTSTNTRHISFRKYRSLSNFFINYSNLMAQANHMYASMWRGARVWHVLGIRGRWGWAAYTEQQQQQQHHNATKCSFSHPPPETGLGTFSCFPFVVHGCFFFIWAAVGCMRKEAADQKRIYKNVERLYMVQAFHFSIINTEIHIQNLSFRWPFSQSEPTKKEKATRMASKHLMCGRMATQHTPRHTAHMSTVLAKPIDMNSISHQNLIEESGRSCTRRAETPHKNIAVSVNTFDIRRKRTYRLLRPTPAKCMSRVFVVSVMLLV